MNYGDVDSPGIFTAARRNGGLSKKQPDIANFVDTDAYWDMMGRVIKPMGKIVNVVKTSGMVDLGCSSLRARRLPLGVHLFTTTDRSVGPCKLTRDGWPE